MKDIRCAVACAVLAIAGVALSFPVSAQTTYDVSLVQSGVATSESYQVAPGHDFIMGTSEWEPPEPEDTGSPFRGLHGTCFGVTELDGEIIVGGGGYCTYEDADGDRLVTRWKPTHQLGNFRTAGEWTAFTGTGKWKGVTGGGTYEVGRDSGPGARTRKLSGQVGLR